MIMKTEEIARLFGVTTRRVNQLAVDGVFQRVDAGKFDATQCVSAYVAHNVNKAAGKEIALDLDRERARLAKLQADGHELKNAQARDELMPRADVVRGWTDILRKVRAGMLAIPSRVRQQIPTIDAAQAAIIDREIRDALTALGNNNAGSNNNGAAGADTAAALAA